jgi:hypothetical protein
VATVVVLAAVAARAQVRADRAERLLERFEFGNAGLGSAFLFLRVGVFPRVARAIFASLAEAVATSRNPKAIEQVVLRLF